MKYQDYLQKKNLISRLFSESETWDPFTICTISEYASGLYEDNDEEVFINEELYEKAGNPLKVLMALIRLS